MIGVVHLDRVEAGLVQRPEVIVDLRPPGMRQRRQTAGGVDDRHDLFRRGPDARHERRPIRAEPPLERLVLSLACPAATIARATCGRPTDTLDCSRASASAASSLTGMPKLGQPRADRFEPGDARGALRGEEPLERRVGDVDEVAEHVHVAAVLDRVISMPATVSMPVLARARLHVGDRRRGVVIGDGHHAHAGRRGAVRPARVA